MQETLKIVVLTGLTGFTGFITAKTRKAKSTKTGFRVRPGMTMKHGGFGYVTF
jgi:hypothetical protein